jgi:hypothetical protein
MPLIRLFSLLAEMPLRHFIAAIAYFHWAITITPLPLIFSLLPYYAIIDYY